MASSFSSYGTASTDPSVDHRISSSKGSYEKYDLGLGHKVETTESSYEAIGQDNHSMYRHKGMSHSLSEGIIDFRYGRAELLASQSNNVQLASDEIPISYSEKISESSSFSHDANSSSPSRGRTYLRSPPSSDYSENFKGASLSSEKLGPKPLKRSHSPMKQLFGEHGWLGRSMSMNELPTEEYRKKTGFKQWGGKLKERVEHLTPGLPRLDISSLTSRLSSPSKSKSRSPRKTRFYVSLSPPFQARLYSEIELMIVATANEYLQTQQREGRMSVDSLTRILEAWVSKNRPQVIEFLFDQATQRELIFYNLKSFRFYGTHANDIISLNSMMQNWKALAREMSVRNFCAPDPMVRKNIIDASKVLEMLGAPMVTITAFTDIRKKAERLIEEGTKESREHEKIQFGKERRWEPPAGSMKGEKYNPFI